MLKSELQEKNNEYFELLRELGRWANPIQYGINDSTPNKILLFHLNGIRNLLDKKFYKLESAQ